MNIQEYADETIAVIVAVAGTGYAGWITYETGQIPEFFAMGFGMVLAFYFGKAKKPET
jgi:hypothetical protein